MAPLGLMSGVRLLARSFGALSCANSLSRCTGVLPGSYLVTARSLTSEVGAPPKRPLNGYMRYLVQQKPLITRQHPEMKVVDITSKIAQQWRTLSPEQKQPFEEESQRARVLFKVELQQYQAQLTPAQTAQQAAERRERMAKRKAIRKKRELNNLGKPKRPRSPFNIYLSEHFVEARGTTTQEKMVLLFQDWKNLFSHQKQVYLQLAEDDKIRYKNEMSSWENHMKEIGREDLLRVHILNANRQKEAAKKREKMAKAKEKAAAKTKASAPKTSKAPAKTARGSSSTTAKTVKGARKP